MGNREERRGRQEEVRARETTDLSLSKRLQLCIWQGKANQLVKHPISFTYKLIFKIYNIPRKKYMSCKDVLIKRFTLMAIRNTIQIP